MAPCRRRADQQRGNPLLTHIKGVAWEYADIVPDYQMGLATGALFLSLRYHRLHPEYIHARIQKLAHMYTLRVLLVLCDVNDHQPAIKELTKVALVNRMALIVAWSPEEAARYLETYKAFEHKPPDLLRSRVADDYMSQLTSVLTNVRGINKTDVLTLASRLGVRNYARVHCMLTLQSISDVADAPHDTLMMLPGMGDVKARSAIRTTYGVVGHLRILAPDDLAAGGDHAEVRHVHLDDRALGKHAELGIHRRLRVLLHANDRQLERRLEVRCWLAPTVPGPCTYGA